MSLASPPRKYTAADLLTMPDGDRFELVDGELVEIEMSNESGWVAGEVYRRIANDAIEGSLGWAFPDNTSYQCYPWDENRIRRPDASFISKARLPEGPLPAGHCPIAPDLAVEVVSPNDLYYDVELKVQEYLRVGVGLVWVVNPVTRSVMVDRAGTESPSRFAESATLTGEPVLPNFRCQVADLFPPRSVAVPR